MTLPESSFFGYLSTSLLRRLRALLATCFLALGAVASFGAVAQLSRVWSGMDSGFFNGELRRFRLEIIVSPTTERTREATPMLFGMLDGQAVSGSLSSELAVGRGATQQVVETVTGIYVEEFQMLILKRENRGRFMANDMLGIVDRRAGSMALAHFGPGSALPPTMAYVGNKEPADLLSFALSGPGSAPSGKDLMEQLQRQKQAQQTGANDQQRAQIAKAKRVQEIQREIAKAIQRGEQARIPDLQRELQGVLAGSIPVEAPAPVATPNSNCPEKILAWVGAMEEQGLSSERFESLARTYNLFRPSVFAPAFGKTFLDFKAGERRQMGMDLSGRCVMDGSAFGRGGVVNTLASVFMDQRGLEALSAAQAGQALDLLASWHEQWVVREGKAASIQQLEGFAEQARIVTAYLWPKEQEAAQAQVAQLVSDRAIVSLNAAIDEFAGKLPSVGAPAMRELTLIPQGPLYAKLTVRDRSSVDAYLARKVDSGLGQVLDAFSREQTALASSAGRLRQTRDWYLQNESWLSAYSNTPQVSKFAAWLAEFREAAFRSALGSLEEELAAAGDAVTVQRVGVGLNLPGDELRSPTWAGFQRARQNRLREIEREVLLARVGDGPFTAEYPGAIYLNALYRGDFGQIRREDELHMAPMRAKFQETLSGPGPDLIGALSGGMVSGENVRGLIDQSLSDVSMSSALLAFYITAYEYVYPDCMDAEPKEYRKTVVMENVVKNGFGTEISRYHGWTQSYYFKINERHARLFEMLGDGDSPESRRMIEQVLKYFGMDSAGAVPLSDALVGLRLAMQTMGCESEVIQRLEKNMTAVVHERKGW